MAVDATHGFLTPQDRAEIDAMVEQQFLPNAELWLATDDSDHPIGFLVMEGTEIDALFVDPEFHGQGYGSRLLDQALTLSPNATVDASEQAANALPFYLSRGFSIVGRSETDGQGRPYPLIHLAR
jgi:putative acetyltransferase